MQVDYHLSRIRSKLKMTWINIIVRINLKRETYPRIWARIDWSTKFK